MKNLKEEVENDLKYLTKEFIKCTSPHIFENLLGTYLALTSIIASQKLDVIIPNELDYETKKIDTSKIDIRQAKRIIKTYQNELEFNKELSRMYDILGDKYFDYTNKVYYQNKIDIKDSIRIVEEFFKDYDPLLSTFYSNYINNERFFIGDLIEEEFNGTTFEGYENVNQYVFICPTYTIVDQAVIAHEIGHAYINENQKFMSIAKRQTYNTNNFAEVYSSFLELIILDYLRKQEEYIHDIECYQQEYDEDLYHNLACFNYQFEPEIKPINEFEEREIYLDIESYTYGKLLAYHFYDNYLNDKEKTKKDILKFMLDSKDYPKDYLLNNYGLKKEKLKDPGILMKHFDNHYYQ